MVSLNFYVAKPPLDAYVAALLRVTKKNSTWKTFHEERDIANSKKFTYLNKKQKKTYRFDRNHIDRVCKCFVLFPFFRFLIHLKKFNYLSHPTTIMKWWNWLTMLHKICGEFQWIDTSSKQNSLQRHLLILWQFFIALKSTDGASGGFALMTSFGIWALLECHWGTYVVGHKKRATFRRSRNNRNKLTKSDDEDDSFKPKVTSTFKEE